MDNFEKVEKLQERANVSYAEAKEALEASNWDLLDAMIYLERAGKTAAPGNSSYRTSGASSNSNEEFANKAKSTAKAFGEKLKELLKKSDENHFIVEHNGKIVFEIPIWALIILAITLWSLCIILFIVGLFTNCKYSFRGPANLSTANKAMDTLENAADSIKTSVQGENR